MSPRGRTQSSSDSSLPSWTRFENVDIKQSKVPLGLQWRSNAFYICCTVGVGAFTDLFLYGLIVPILPFLLQDRVNVPESELQSSISYLLAIYALASCLASPIAGVMADKLSSSRQLPFLLGLVMLLLSTILLAVGQNFAVLVIARFLQGASGGTVWTIGLALLIETVGQENLGKTIGTIFSFISVAGFFSPVVGGFLYAKSGYVGVFGVGIALVSIDFIMRLLMIEKKVAAKYIDASDSECDAQEVSLTEGKTIISYFVNSAIFIYQQSLHKAFADPAQSDSSEAATVTAETPLLSQRSADLVNYRLPEPKQRITRMLPILLVLRDPGLLTAFFIGFMQAVLFGAFDATIPIVASSRYGFDSLKAGLLFVPLGGADFLLGPVFGWCVDRWGTKPVSIFGFTFLVPALVLLRLPTEVATHLQRGHQIALYACLLAVNGMGLAIINSTSIVESGNVMEKYWKANSELFEGQAPYAQLYGINSMIWSAGLTVGPLVGGYLRERIGYGNMNAVLAGVCAATAVLAALFIGRKVEIKSRADEGEIN